MSDKRNLTPTDHEIGQILRGGRKPLPRDEWFVRKTMNRLPPERETLVGMPQVVAFIFVMAFFGMVLLGEMSQLVDPSSADDYNIWRLVVISTVALVTVTCMALGVLRRCS